MYYACMYAAQLHRWSHAHAAACMCMHACMPRNCTAGVTRTLPRACACVCATCWVCCCDAVLAVPGAVMCGLSLPQTRELCHKLPAALDACRNPPADQCPQLSRLHPSLCGCVCHAVHACVCSVARCVRPRAGPMHHAHPHAHCFMYDTHMRPPPAFACTGWW